MTFGNLRAKLGAVEKWGEDYKISLFSDKKTADALGELCGAELCLFDGAEINRTVLLWLLLEHLAGDENDATRLFDKLIDELFSKAKKEGEIKNLFDAWYS